MPWFKTRYVRSLEVELLRLQTELKQLRYYNHQLTERLLNKAGVPNVQLPDELTDRGIEKMLESTDIFEDISEDQDPIDELIDNRRGEKYDDILT